MAVAAQSREPVMTATLLKQLRITDELHVLQSWKQSLVSVPDPNGHLYCTHARVLEIVSDGCRRAGIESTVGVDQTDDHVPAQTALQNPMTCEVLEGRVESSALTPSRLGQLSPQ